MALKKRLNTDASLRPILAQYVPLDLDVKSPAYQSWARQYRPAGNGIPQIYIVRADGEVLYNNSGAPQGAALTQLLVGARKTAGRALGAEEAQQLAEAVKTAQAALEDDDLGAAVKAVGQVSVDDSFAEPVVKAREIATQLAEKATGLIADAEAKLNSTEEALDGALVLAEVERNFRTIAEVQRQLREARGKHREKRTLFAQASALDKGLEYLAEERNSSALRSFQSVVERYPRTDAAALAANHVKDLEAAGITSDGDDRPSTTATAAADPAPSESGSSDSGSDSGSVPSERDYKKAASYLRLAQTFAKNEDREEKAKEYAQKVVDLVPRSKLAQQARELLSKFQ